MDAPIVVPEGFKTDCHSQMVAEVVYNALIVVLFLKHHHNTGCLRVKCQKVNGF